MKKFSNSTCAICEKNIQETDDIVVCPDCGTPYHRECFAIEQKCVRDDLHQTGDTYKAPASVVCSKCFKVVTDSQSKVCDHCQWDLSVPYVHPILKKPCSNCGKEISKDAESCEHCSSKQLDVKDGEEIKGTINPIEYYIKMMEDIKEEKNVIEGISAKEYSKYVKQNVEYFKFRFVMLEKGQKGINWSAFVFSGLYYLYRKMYKKGLLLSLAYLILQIPYTLLVMSQVDLGLPAEYVIELTQSQDTLLTSLVFVANFLVMGLRFYCGTSFNKHYYDRVKGDLIKARESGYTETEREDMYKKRGGVSNVTLFSLIGVYYILIVIAYFNN